jgi:hypothetical protein
MAQAQYQKFCTECGRAAPVAVSASDAAVQPAIKKAPASSPLESATNVLIVICIVLSGISIATFHGYAAALAVACIVIGGLTVFSKRITSRKKFYALAIAIVGILVINTIEGWQERKQEQRQAEVAAQQVAQSALEQQKKEEAFKALSPAEHLEHAKSLLSVNAPPASVAEASKHLAAIAPNSVEAAEGAKFKREYDIAKRRQAEVVAKVQAAAARKRAADAAVVNRILRDVMAKTIENKMLDQGYNVDVKAIGDDHTTLHIEWILVSKVLAHQMSKQGDFFEEARKAGFKKVEISDGYDESWYWNLK